MVICQVNSHIFSSQDLYCYSWCCSFVTGRYGSLGSLKLDCVWKAQFYEVLLNMCWFTCITINKETQWNGIQRIESCTTNFWYFSETIKLTTVLSVFIWA